MGRPEALDASHATVDGLSGISWSQVVGVYRVVEEIHLYPHPSPLSISSHIRLVSMSRLMSFSPDNPAHHSHEHPIDAARSEKEKEKPFSDDDRSPSNTDGGSSFVAIDAKSKGVVEMEQLLERTTPKLKIALFIAFTVLAYVLSLSTSLAATPGTRGACLT
jgi:hypothetical protein